MEIEDDVEEEHHGHDAQEMTTLKDIIAHSLMSARNNVEWVMINYVVILC